MKKNEDYWMFFCGIDGLGAARFDRLLGHFGNAEAIFKTSESSLRECEENDSGIIDDIIEKRKDYDFERAQEELEEQNIKFVCRQSEAYPEKLNNIGSPPNGLYYRGKLPEEKRPSVAVIGSRVCSAYGREISIQFAKEMGKLGIDIISGMAAGVDGYAHRGAMNGGGETYAILGCGPDICYPKSNDDIYRRICEHGGMISEYPPGTQPAAFNFPRRNRIISGLADGILVVEAREKSGTLITVDMGLEQGKDIYAIPGRIGDELSYGCNRLIRQGARLVTSPADIIAELAPKYGFTFDESGKNSIGRKRKIPRGLSSGQAMVLKCLDYTPRGTGEIALRTGLDAAEIMAALTMLEIRGLCRSAGNGCFVVVGDV